MLRQLKMTVIVAPLAMVLALGGVWVYGSLTIEQPYDEVWIGLNSPLPAPLRAWACAQVRSRVAGPSLPPIGCEGLWK